MTAYVYKVTVDNMSNKFVLPVLISKHSNNDEAVEAAYKAAEAYRERYGINGGIIPCRAKWIVWNCQGYKTVIFWATIHKQIFTAVERR